MFAYFCVYLDGWNVGKLVVVAKDEQQAIDKLVDLTIKESDILRVKLIGNVVQ